MGDFYDARALFGHVARCFGQFSRECPIPGFLCTDVERPVGLGRTPKSYDRACRLKRTRSFAGASGTSFSECMTQAAHSHPERCKKMAPSHNKQRLNLPHTKRATNTGGRSFPRYTGCVRVRHTLCPAWGSLISEPVIGKSEVMNPASKFPRVSSKYQNLRSPRGSERVRERSIATAFAIRLVLGRRSAEDE